MTTFNMLRSSLNGVNLMSSFDVFGGFETALVLERSPTQYVFQEAGQGDIFTFAGTDLTYHSTLQTLQSGIVHQMTITAFGQTYLTLPDVRIGASTFNLIAQKDWYVLNVILFSDGDTFHLSDGNDTVRGYRGHDTLYGYGGDDALLGDPENDHLFGGAGNDRLYGGAGADTLVGGTGIDKLWGGMRRDSFIFTETSSAHRDYIQDFFTREDRLVFENDVFTGLGTITGRLSPSAFRVGTEAKDSSDRIIFQRDKGYVWYDPDGTGPDAKSLVAVLVKDAALAWFDVYIQ